MISEAEGSLQFFGGTIAEKGCNICQLAVAAIRIKYFCFDLVPSFYLAE